MVSNVRGTLPEFLYCLLYTAYRHIKNVDLPLFKKNKERKEYTLESERQFNRLACVLCMKEARFDSLI